MAQVWTNGLGGVLISITDPDELARVMAALKRTKSTRVARLRAKVVEVVAEAAAAEAAAEVVAGLEELLAEEAGE